MVVLPDDQPMVVSPADQPMVVSTADQTMVVSPAVINVNDMLQIVLFVHDQATKFAMLEHNKQTLCIKGFISPSIAH